MGVSEASDRGSESNSAAVVLIESGDGVGWARRAVDENAEEVGVETRLL